MAGTGDNESTRPYNVVGAFPTERDATMAVERLTTDVIAPQTHLLQRAGDQRSCVRDGRPTIRSG